ncbi:MAG: hypothetical protein COA96_01515 [SAR86 cluster bacterium]|uniref:Uncharacterized protein n=1 Tax=SAR86 cluster bacterium TaxID=2030880 RepID=A0A2A5B9H7_9GAMM|nr:MAG: hypothetical protein COA96_01515 [SAR86 cluster bacterium]
MFKVLTAIFFVTTLFFGYTSYVFISESIDQENQLNCARELTEIFQSLATDTDSIHDIDILLAWLKEYSPNYVKISPNTIQSECSLISYANGSLLEVASDITYVGFPISVSVPK